MKITGNPFLNILALSVALTIIFQLYLFFNTLSNYCKRKNKLLIISYFIEICLLLCYPIILIIPIINEINYKSQFYTFIINNFNYMTQILFKNIIIYLLTYRFQPFIFIGFSTIVSLLILSIPYKELSRLIFICVSTSEYLLFLIIAYNFNFIKEFIILLVLKVLEIVNIFDLSRSNQSVIEILSYLVQFEVIKKKILNRTLKDNNGKGNELNYESEGLSVLDELYQ